MRERSDKTEIRYLRSTLRHARYVLRGWLGDLRPEYREGYTRDVLRMIDDDLAPKRRRRTR